MSSRRGINRRRHTGKPAALTGNFWEGDFHHREHRGEILCDLCDFAHSAFKTRQRRLFRVTVFVFLRFLFSDIADERFHGFVIEVAFFFEVAVDLFLECAEVVGVHLQFEIVE